MNKLKEIIIRLKEICKEELKDIEQRDVLNNAIKIYLSDKSQGKLGTPHKTLPALGITDKQKNVLKKLGYKGTFDLTKEESRILIKEMIENKGGFDKDGRYQ